MDPVDQEIVLHPLLVFAIEGGAFGIRLGAVKEIHQPTGLRRVPLAPAVIRGIADVRGRMVTAADLPVLLAGRSGSDAPGHLMILAEPRDHFALWLPTEIDLRNLDLSTLRPRPATEGEADLFDGFVSSGETLVNVLSTEKIFLHCEQEVIRRYRVASV